MPMPPSLGRQLSTQLGLDDRLCLAGLRVQQVGALVAARVAVVDGEAHLTRGHVSFRVEEPLDLPCPQPTGTAGVDHVQLGAAPDPLADEQPAALPLNRETSPASAQLLVSTVVGERETVAHHRTVLVEHCLPGCGDRSVTMSSGFLLGAVWQRVHVLDGGGGGAR